MYERAEESSESLSATPSRPLGVVPKPLGKYRFQLHYKRRSSENSFKIVALSEEKT